MKFAWNHCRVECGLKDDAIKDSLEFLGNLGIEWNIIWLHDVAESRCHAVNLDEMTCQKWSLHRFFSGIVTGLPIVESSTIYLIEIATDNLEDDDDAS